MENIEKNHLLFALGYVVLLPTILLIIGYFFVPYPASIRIQQITWIPLFLGLSILGLGVLLRNKKQGSWLKIVGWILFSFFWATMPQFLYRSEGGDIFNAVVAICGVYVLMYIGYHEWWATQTGKHPTCLSWIAGGTFVAGIIYFIFDLGLFPTFKEGLIEIVAIQSAFLLNLFTSNVVQNGSSIAYKDTHITIIFACTAIQSIVLFVGMNAAVSKVPLVRKSIAICCTVLPIYLLNLIRNAGVIYMVGSGLTSFHIAHNVIAKVGSLVALIILLIINFKIIPELYDEILCVFHLRNRNGPLEKIGKKIVQGKKE